jgi:hypothetical protein
LLSIVFYKTGNHTIDPTFKKEGDSSKLKVSSSWQLCNVTVTAWIKDKYVEQRWIYIPRFIKLRSIDDTKVVVGGRTEDFHGYKNVTK